MKKTLLIFKYTFLIVIAVLGIGLSGVAPIKKAIADKDDIELNTEILDDSMNDDEKELDLALKF